MLDLLIGLAFGALLLRLADRLQKPRPVPVPQSQRDPRASRR
jgi:hypothetical protein